MFEMINSTHSASMISLRSRRPMMRASVGAAMPPSTAVAVTVCPAAPSLIPMPRAKGVSRPAGKNSLLTRAKVPKLSEMTASQIDGDQGR
jgi:hypothetical protein